MGDMPFALYGPDMYQVSNVCHTLGDLLADCDCCYANSCFLFSCIIQCLSSSICSLLATALQQSCPPEQEKGSISPKSVKV